MTFSFLLLSITNFGKFLSPPPHTVCSNGLYANISTQHQVQQSFDTKVVFDTKIKATTKWQTSNFLIRDGRTRVAQVPPDWGRSGYLTLTERRADHAYQITNCPLCPHFKTCHLPCNPKFSSIFHFHRVNKGGIRGL